MKNIKDIKTTFSFILEKGYKIMDYGYCRCSTNESKQDIERQVRELESLGIQRKHIYLEYASGTKEDRIELNKLLDIVVAGDSITSTEVSRVTRSTKQLCEILEFAKANNIKLVLGTFIVDCTKQLDPMTERNAKNDGCFR